MKKPKQRKIALALTWDGARWPIKSLPLKARRFLGVNSSVQALPSPSELAACFAHDDISEIRICWVPRLKGGTKVLCEPFETLTGRRRAYSPAQLTPFGDVLGVVYRQADLD